MTHKTLTQIHCENTGKVSDKWSSYVQYYDQIFLPLKLEQINILEIGVQNGGSLETWAQYFPNAAHIIGCDIDPSCEQLTYTEERIH